MLRKCWLPPWSSSSKFFATPELRLPSNIEASTFATRWRPKATEDNPAFPSFRSRASTVNCFGCSSSNFKAKKIANTCNTTCATGPPRASASAFAMHTRRKSFVYVSRGQRLAARQALNVPQGTPRLAIYLVLEQGNGQAWLCSLRCPCAGP